MIQSFRSIAAIRENLILSVLIVLLVEGPPIDHLMLIKMSLLLLSLLLENKRIIIVALLLESHFALLFLLKISLHRYLNLNLNFKLYRNRT